MAPSPLAVAAYAAIKVAGYAAFAHGMNKVLDRKVSLLKFGVAKTAIGFIGGLVYLFAVFPLLHLQQQSELGFYVGAIPIRLLAWATALSIFYGFRNQPSVVGAAIPLGAVWSYLLDGLMGLLFVLPGMQMGFC
jgi:hypothetical protein